MASMKLGSKADLFHLEGQSWLCTTGLASDVCIEVGETSFHLHKFPLLTRSQLLEKLIQDFSINQKKNEDIKCVLPLHDLPGGEKTFLLIAKFCYGVKFELTAREVVSLRCAAEYLQMNEDYGEGNLISQTEIFLDEVLRSWVDTIKALQTCNEVLPFSEELRIISRCIDSLATKACADRTFFGRPQSPRANALWNGIDPSSKLGPTTDDWWYEDVAILELPLFKRLILAIASKGIITPEGFAGALMFYATRYLPLNDRSIIPVLSDADQRTLIEEIIFLLPNQNGVIATKLLFRLLRTSIVLNASPLSRESLERMIGSQLDRADLQDLLIPTTGYYVETLYDVDCVQRIVDHFLDHENANMTAVANLLDDYLAEVAADANLKLEKFLSLAAAIPSYARPLDDGIYRAIDVYLKVHPWLTDEEREKLCRLINCKKLSLEASSHAAENERLPLRVIVQVLFFEQLRLKTSVAGWFFVSDNLDSSENVVPVKSGACQVFTFNQMRERVCELEKECQNMKNEMQKLVKTRRSWNDLYRRFGLKFKFKSSNITTRTMLSCTGGALQPSRKPVLSMLEDHESKLDD